MDMYVPEGFCGDDADYEAGERTWDEISETIEAVNHPPHYTFGKYEVIDVLEDWFPYDPLLWQAGKYIARANHKGNKLQDMKKALFYLERAIFKLEVEE